MRWLLQQSYLDQKYINLLQILQNADTGLLARSKKSEQISPVLASLHRLPVCFRINFRDFTADF